MKRVERSPEIVAAFDEFVAIEPEEEVQEEEPSGTRDVELIDGIGSINDDDDDDNFEDDKDVEVEKVDGEEEEEEADGEDDSGVRGEARPEAGGMLAREGGSDNEESFKSEGCREDEEDGVSSGSVVGVGEPAGRSGMGQLSARLRERFSSMKKLGERIENPLSTCSTRCRSG